MADALDAFPHQRLDCFHVARDFCVDVRRVVRLLPSERVDTLRRTADRIGAMLAGLIRRLEPAIGTPSPGVVS